MQGTMAYNKEDIYEIEQEMLPVAVLELEKSVNNRKTNLEKLVEAFLRNLRSLDYVGATHE